MKNRQPARRQREVVSTDTQEEEEQVQFPAPPSSVSRAYLRMMEPLCPANTAEIIIQYLTDLLQAISRHSTTSSTSSTSFESRGIALHNPRFVADVASNEFATLLLKRLGYSDPTNCGYITCRVSSGDEDALFNLFCAAHCELSMVEAAFRGKAPATKNLAMWMRQRHSKFRVVVTNGNVAQQQLLSPDVVFCFSSENQQQEQQKSGEVKFRCGGLVCFSTLSVGSAILHPTSRLVLLAPAPGGRAVLFVDRVLGSLEELVGLFSTVRGLRVTQQTVAIVSMIETQMMVTMSTVMAQYGFRMVSDRRTTSSSSSCYRCVVFVSGSNNSDDLVITIETVLAGADVGETKQPPAQFHIIGLPYF
eukprot:PhM_4_TR9659/c0_g1_i1/m.53021